MPFLCKIFNKVKPNIFMLGTFHTSRQGWRLCGVPNRVELHFFENFLSPAFLINARTCSQEVNAEGDGLKKIVDASKDRSKVIPVEVSIRYLNSSAYQTTYGEDSVWKHYRRNHKGQNPPSKTRKKCVRKDLISTGNPCPVCRDEYLVLHPKNTKLLNQFISSHTGAVLSYQLTGLCQHRHNELLVAIMQAKDMGLITFDLPFQKYDYSEYIDTSKLK